MNPQSDLASPVPGPPPPVVRTGPPATPPPPTDELRATPPDRDGFESSPSPCRATPPPPAIAGLPTPCTGRSPPSARLLPRSRRGPAIGPPSASPRASSSDRALADRSPPTFGTTPRAISIAEPLVSASCRGSDSSGPQAASPPSARRRARPKRLRACAYIASWPGRAGEPCRGAASCGQREGETGRAGGGGGLLRWAATGLLGGCETRSQDHAEDKQRPGHRGLLHDLVTLPSVSRTAAPSLHALPDQRPQSSSHGQAASGSAAERGSHTPCSRSHAQLQFGTAAPPSSTLPPCASSSSTAAAPP